VSQQAAAAGLRGAHSALEAVRELQPRAGAVAVFVGGLEPLVERV